MIIAEDSTPDNLLIINLVTDAHKAGLLVHPYTFRKDSGSIPKYAKNFEQMLDIFLYTVGVDGIFKDFPDLVINHIRQVNSR